MFHLVITHLVVFGMVTFPMEQVRYREVYGGVSARVRSEGNGS